MPNPNPNESMKDYVARYMSSEEAKKTFPEEKQRLAVAYSNWEEHNKKSKTETKSNEVGLYDTWIAPKIHEVSKDNEKITYFYGATTLPIRKGGVNYSGQEYDREAFSKKALDNTATMINDTSRLGGDKGSFRTISLFHDRVYAKDPTREEAGFVLPEAVVEPLKDYPGHYGLKVATKVNAKYVPPKEYSDYDAEKIQYKIENGAMGLSIEYDNKPNQEKIIKYNNERINIIEEVTDFRGFGYARPNMIADPASVKIQELGAMINTTTTGEKKMDNQEYETKLREIEANNVALAKELADIKAREVKTQSTENELAKVREAISAGFSNIQIKGPQTNTETVTGKAREMKEALVNKDFSKMREIQDEIVKSREAQLMHSFEKKGFDWNDASTLKVRCKGRGFEVFETAKTREVTESLGKTRDVIDANDMNESTLYQTNAMFADRYVMGITETFLKEDSLLKAMLKVPHIGGNDQYQWKIWVDFGTFTGTNTAAVDPNTISVSTTQRDFIKLQTPLREYRDAVEVTDWTKAHSIGVVDLMNEEINRAAEFVTNSMNADLFKPYGDATTGWKGFNGLLYIADSATYTSYGGKTRSAANRLLDATTANTYLSTAENITTQVIRSGYEKVLAQGSKLSEIAIVTSPTQVRRLFDTEGAGIRYQRGELSMGAAPASWGFDRAMIPYVDGVPVIRDYRCTDVSGNFDTFVVVDIGPNGFILVTSKPLGMTGLAKVGTSEKAYVSFWGQSVYKRPRNIFLHDSLTVA